MTPEVACIIIGLIAGFLLTVLIFWLNHRPDGVEPDCAPLGVPSKLDLEVMLNQNLSWLDWQDMTPAQKSDATDAYFKSRRF